MNVLGENWARVL